MPIASFERRTMDEGYLCELCERLLKQPTTSHHLVPRACHRRPRFRRRFTRQELLTTIELCRDCHRAVHELVPDERQLGSEFHTVERLRAHPDIARFLTWVRKQK